MTKDSIFQYSNPIMAGLLPEYVIKIDNICKLSWDFDNINIVKQLENSKNKHAKYKYVQNCSYYNFKRNEKNIKAIIDYILSNIKKPRTFMYYLSIILTLIEISTSIQQSNQNYNMNNIANYHDHNMKVYEKINEYCKSYLNLE